MASSIICMTSRFLCSNIQYIVLSYIQVYCLNSWFYTPGPNVPGRFEIIRKSICMFSTLWYHGRYIQILFYSGMRIYMKSKIDQICESFYINNNTAYRYLNLSSWILKLWCSDKWWVSTYNISHILTCISILDTLQTTFI